MESINLKFSTFDKSTFFIKTEQKIKGMYYGIVSLKKEFFSSLVEIADLIAAAYPIPRNLRERIENIILPRFYEISDIINTNQFLPSEIEVEISQLNKEDLLYGLNSSSINKLLLDRNIISNELKEWINKIDFEKY